MKKTISFSSPFIGTRLLLLIFSLGFITINTSNTTPFTDDATHLSRAPIHLDGHLSFDGLDHAARDFGNRCSLFPLAVLHPKSVSDISRVVKYVYEKGLESSLTVAARGNGHSLEGQAQAHKGVVIDMVSLEGEGMIFGYDRVEVSGGELWINVLHESIKRGMTPRSWTDYLHLTVGGTLSNAGISGQAFRHGPQIDNVYQLQVVTGKGEVLDCSEGHNSDIFHGVLGGLGQFGIITKATIALQPAPTKVKWIRALYSDFSIFTEDQEHLISSEKTFDYIEGFAIKNKTGLLNNWKSSSFSPKDPVQLANPLVSQGNIFFCLEVAKYFNPQESHHIDQDIDEMLSGLKYIESTVFVSEVSYVDFLDRVHISEMKLREKGLWEVPHPWLNLLVPRSSIHEFAKEVFGNIIMDTNNGPVLIYPVNKSRWKTNKKSFVTPDEDIFYLVAFLSSAIPSGKDGLESILIRNNKILDFCKRARLRVKQYLPHYSTTEDWKNHFGAEWGVFSTRKLSYDPLAILAPGQRIFQRSKGFALQ